MWEGERGEGGGGERGGESNEGLREGREVSGEE